MTRQEMIKKLEEIQEELLWGSNDELTNHAKKWTYIFVADALECVQKNCEVNEND